LFGPLVEDSALYAIRNADGETRVAVGVAAPGAAIPHGAMLDNRGVVWVAAEAVEAVVTELRGRELVTVTIVDGAWAAWARAEHHARRASLSSEWCLRSDGPQWVGDMGVCDDLCAALLRIPPGSDEVSAPTVAPRNPYPTSAFAFRRATTQFARDGLSELSAAGGLFHGKFNDGTRAGVTLADLLP
jgi:hypothetical protein